MFVRAFFRGLGIGESRFRTMFCHSWHLSTAWVMLKVDSSFTRCGLPPLASPLTSVSLFASAGPSSNAVGCLDLSLSLRNLGNGGGEGEGEGEGKGERKVKGGGREKGGRGEESEGGKVEGGGGRGYESEKGWEEV